MKEVINTLEISEIINLPNGAQTKTENLIRLFGKENLLSLDYDLLIGLDRGRLGYKPFFDELKQKGILK